MLHQSEHSPIQTARKSSNFEPIFFEFRTLEHTQIESSKRQIVEWCTEMVAVEEVYNKAIKGTSRPLLIFNGELDRIRTGYYPPFFYPGLARMARDWLPQFCTAYYIHNFKGSRPGESARQHPLI